MKLLFFLLMPFVDLYLLIVAGGYIGPHLTIFLVVFTSVLGFLLLRHQMSSGFRIAQAVALSRVEPERPLLDGVLILVGAVLLMVPGFLSDFIGLLTLVPAVRGWVFRRISRRLNVEVSVDRQQTVSRTHRRTIDGEYKRED